MPLVVSRQLLQTFATDLDKLEPENQKQIANYTLTQIQPRVVSFEEQVRFRVPGNFGFNSCDTMRGGCFVFRVCASFRVLVDDYCILSRFGSIIGFLDWCCFM